MPPQTLRHYTRDVPCHTFWRQGCRYAHGLLLKSSVNVFIMEKYIWIKIIPAQSFTIAEDVAKIRGICVGCISMARYRECTELVLPFHECWEPAEGLPFLANLQFSASNTTSFTRFLQKHVPSEEFRSSTSCYCAVRQCRNVWTAVL